MKESLKMVIIEIFKAYYKLHKTCIQPPGLSIDIRQLVVVFPVLEKTNE